MSDFLWFLLIAISLGASFISGWYRGYHDGKEVGQGIGYRRGRAIR